MSRERTGSVEPRRRADASIYYRARVWLADGTRDRVIVPERYGYSRERAEVYAEALQEDEDETGNLLAKKRERVARRSLEQSAANGETCTAYRARLEKHRAELGKRSGDADASRWRTWIGPRIGHRPIANVTREEIETIRDDLDVAVTKGTLSGASARNVWTVVTTTFKAATRSKRRDLRVRADNPCADVLPPERGTARRRTFLYPREASMLFACEHVARELRELYAIGIYLYLRPNELAALTWTDVEIDTAIAHITKALDEKTGATHPPKTRNGVRDVPIPASLLPLLGRMRADAEERAKAERKPDAWKTAPVVPIMRSRSLFERARSFRTHLQKAGVDRARLFADTATEEPIDFRSLRDSGITFLALSGVDVAKMQRRAGHDDPATTFGYVKLAEDLTGSIGEPFAPLPDALVAARHDTHAAVGGSSIRPPIRPPSTIGAFSCKNTEKFSDPNGNRTNENSGNPENSVGSRDERGGLSARVDVSNSPPGHLQNTTISALRPTLEELRVKLDRAIASEAWDAVKIVAARIREIEREGVVDLEARRQRRERPT